MYANVCAKNFLSMRKKGKRNGLRKKHWSTKVIPFPSIIELKSKFNRHKFPGNIILKSLFH